MDCKDEVNRLFFANNFGTISLIIFFSKYNESVHGFCIRTPGETKTICNL